MCDVLVYRFFFFFSSRRRHTRSDRDWSSDVCSSDLLLDSFTGPVRTVQGGESHVGSGNSNRFPQTLDLTAAFDRKSMTPIRRSHSTPGLTHLLSHKLSMTFGHPTVVHRAKLRSRPSIPNMP